MSRVLVAMSGGVDSSVTAWLLRSQGYDCIGVTMKLYEGVDGRESTCCSLTDVEDAKSVCHRLGIPHYTFNYTADFDRCVIAPFQESYEQGRTPNPCIACNRYLKFDRLLRRAMELGCDYIATGHYVRRTVSPEGLVSLYKAADEKKEQSYVLYNLTQAQLQRILFPLGDLQKSQVREIAEAQGFLNAKKHDSQDICFVPDGDYGAFLEARRGRPYPSGPVVDTAGHVLGTHRGIVHYTVGQRQGLGISAPQRMYVGRVDPETNTVTLCRKEELYSTVVYGADLNWIPGPVPAHPVSVTARVRYHGADQPATLYFLQDGQVRAEFAVAQRAVTPGQAMVFYDGDRLLGGAEILRARPGKECTHE